MGWFEADIGNDRVALRSHPDYRVQRGQLFAWQLFAWQLFAVIKQKAKPKFGFFTNLLS